MKEFIDVEEILMKCGFKVGFDPIYDRSLYKNEIFSRTADFRYIFIHMCVREWERNRVSSKQNLFQEKKKMAKTDGTRTCGLLLRQRKRRDSRYTTADTHRVLGDFSSILSSMYVCVFLYTLHTS